jgi:hypothetical protein
VNLGRGKYRQLHHQVYAIINPITGEEISEGERTPRANHGRHRNMDTSASNNNNAYTITGEEWEIA